MYWKSTQPVLDFYYMLAFSIFHQNRDHFNQVQFSCLKIKHLQSFNCLGQIMYGGELNLYCVDSILHHQKAFLLLVCGHYN